MKLKFAALLVAALAFACSPMWGGTVTFSFSSNSEITASSSLLAGAACPCNLTTSTATYTVSGLSVTAAGFLTSAATNNLFIKNEGSAESGLGLSGTSDNEINPGQYVYLNMSSLLSHGVTSGTLFLGSVQSGEGARVCETTAVGMPGSLNCVTFTGNGTAIVSNLVSWSHADPILSITATSGNVLGDRLQVDGPDSIAEPSTLVLLGVALLVGLVLFKRLGPSETLS